MFWAKDQKDKVSEFLSLKENNYTFRYTWNITGVVMSEDIIIKRIKHTYYKTLDNKLEVINWQDLTELITWYDYKVNED